jgi:membrane protein
MGSWRQRWITPFWKAYRLWLRHDCVDLSAAFAYHGLQSIFPLCLIALAIASALLGRAEALQERVLELIAGVVPAVAVPVVEAGLDRFLQQGAGAGFAGVVILGLTASNAYLTLQRGADRLWFHRPWLPATPRSGRAVVWRFLLLRGKALAWVLVVGLFITADQVLLRGRFAALTPLRQWFLSPVLVVPLSILLAIGASLVLLKTLPSQAIPWRTFLPGAVCLGLSIHLLNLALTTLLPALGVRFQAYGVVGGVLLFTLWIWLIGVLIYYAQCLCLAFSRSGQSRFSRMVDEPPAR